jgi:hypothetical protein
MAQTTRQTNLLVEQDWTKVYQSFTNADFASYDFETLRASMINYIKTYYPETFNDFVESSEYLALIDCIAFLGQSLAFRTDLNARENFLDTAQRRDSILKLARMLAYNPTRTQSASGLLKIDRISTTESLSDSAGNNLTNATVQWNDLTNDNWLEQFTTILNAAFVNSQAVGKPANSQSINGIQTDEYSISLNPQNLPVAPFQAVIQNESTNFEAVSATTVGESYVYEADPTNVGIFNILYRNDNNGNGSNNTGFFVYFKQGSLQSTNFSIQNAVPNNFVTINTSNINHTDHWLYKLDTNNRPQIVWQAVPALSGINVVYNQLANKNLYQINSMSSDTVNLIFGDGSFSNIPQGSFSFWYRTSNGLAYSITPDDLPSVNIPIYYTSKKGTIETLTVIASLKYSVTNATTTQSLASVKSYAPQQYYTQNRMITGEDYNIFPQTSYTSIQKVKAVNRTSSGVSLYLDSIDPTSSFSSTNIFGDDGILTANSRISTLTFDFLTTTDIYNAIYNDIIPTVSGVGMNNYYYKNYTRYNSTRANITFVQSANTTVSSTGNLTYLTSGNVQDVGTGISSNLKYITPGASLQFSAPTGYYFDAQHKLISGNPAVSSDTLNFYAAVTRVVAGDDNQTPNQITFGTQVPTGAILSEPSASLTGQNAIIPVYKNNFTTSLIDTIVSQIGARVNFGLIYNQTNQAWENITPSSIGTSTDWLLKFTYNQGLYNVQYRNLEYTFGSDRSTVFYFDPKVKVYDSLTGTNVTDIVKILKINTQPGSNNPLANDVIWQIYNTITAEDGYVDNNQVLVKSASTQMDGVPDNPDLFTLVADGNNTRSDLYFQYKHNVPARNRIDPTPINIIDLYILTADYSSDYFKWLRDLTGTITEPIAPTSGSLEIAYSGLNNYKTISDTLIYNPAKFKPLFGAKANTMLQARFQVVKNSAINLTDNEIKSRVISAINNYFSIANWGFGDTFYFSELSAYLHKVLAPAISSVVIIPAGDNMAFGNYFQINSEPWEIIASAATVNDIDIVSAVTAAGLNLTAPLVGGY